MYCFSQGVPAETFEAVAAAALPAIPTWKLHKLGRKEPNAYCSKYKASEEFLHVQLLRQGVPAETFEAVVTSALPTWKPPNYEKNILIQTTQCTKLQKSSYMYCFSQGSRSWDFWGRCGCSVTSHTYLKTPQIGKKRAKCKLLKVQSFRRVPSCTASQTGGPSWDFWGRCDFSVTYLKTPKLWKKYPNSNYSMYQASEEFLHVPLL